MSSKALSQLLLIGVSRLDPLLTSMHVETCPVGMYYAAQIGISIGTKSNEARAYLGNVLEQLESIKHGISADAGVQEVVDHEIQSAAYVETFALKVFNLADNTDRSGKATR
jgi:vacuolar protein sorting-associated protein VTA1